MTLVADYPGMEAGAVARLVQRRELSPVETVEAALAAIARLDDRLNAIPTIAADSARGCRPRPRSAASFAASRSARSPACRW